MSTMGSLLSSPRRRRRVLWTIGLLVVCVAVVIGVSAMPGPQKLPPDTFGKAQAKDITIGDTPIKVTPHMRTEISQALDQFVPAAVSRKHPERAYTAATPNLRSQATPTQWRNGDIPVQPFPIRPGQSFHGWTVNFAYKKQVNLDLLVMPDLKKESHPLAFTIDMRQVDGKWLVDSVFPVAVFAPLPKQGNRGPMISTYDLVPGQAGAAGKSRESYAWFLVPFGFVGVGLMAIFFVIARGIFRDRRTRAGQRKTLPPLPRTGSE
jgi:hypothetical protein